MITTILTTIFLLLLGILLWQLFMPGSALRYYFCRKGRMNPHGSANFWYISERDKDVVSYPLSLREKFSLAHFWCMYISEQNKGLVGYKRCSFQFMLSFESFVKNVI